MNELQSHAFQSAKRSRRRGTNVRPTDVVWGVCLGLCAVILLVYGWHLRGRAANISSSNDDTEDAKPSSYRSAPLLVSYAFYEKDVIQRNNLEFFLQHGWVAPPGRRQSVTWVFVVSGELCSPCSWAFPITTPLAADPDIGVLRASRVDRSADDADEAGQQPPRHRHQGPHGDEAEGSGALTGRLGGPGPGPSLVLWRSENVGMDLAAHNVSLEYLERHAGGISRYRYVLLINSSTKGPFYPAYMPTDWHWTHAFLERFLPLPLDDPRWARPPALHVLPPGTHYGTAGPRPVGPAVVRAVGCSLVCLPEADAGGPGPRLESWALALDQVALELLIQKGVFRVRTCKTCADGEDGIVVGGEYGMTSALLEAGHNVATLMSKYARDVDWRDRRHWGCNDMVHPSRHGTYDGIAFHPYETIFVKSSWHVADPYTRRYSLWVTQHKEGDAGTDGDWNEKLYRFAISAEAQVPNLLEAAYNVERVHQLMAKQQEVEVQSLAEEQRAAGERAMSLDM